MKWQSFDQLKNLLCTLVEHPSITGTKEEVSFSEHLYYLLKSFPYFEANQEHLKLHSLRDGRQYLTALVKKGKQKETVILLSHFDVVDTKDYGHLEHLAFRPRELTDELKNYKERMSKYVLNDLTSGDWLFGRGVMDMKAGLTVQLSMLERAMNGEFDGNLLLLTVPDEEANSEGMLGAIPYLQHVANEYDLDLKACINCEPMFAQFPNDDHLYVYTGSIGKILAGFFCKGIETHVGEPFSGLNANLMVSELNRLLELNDTFCEIVDGEVTPPPTNLMQKDLKEEYSVQIPHESVSMFNILMMNRSLKDIHTLLFQTAVQAAEQIERTYRVREKSFRTKVQFSPRPTAVSVFTYQQLLQKAIERHGEGEVGRRMDYLQSNRGSLGDRDFSTRLVAELASLCQEESPMIVLFYSPPFYPAVSSKGDKRIESLTKQLIDYAKNTYDLELTRLNYFPGLSDLSFMQLNEDTKSLHMLTSNMPLYGKGYYMPFHEMKALNVPIFNVGPYGKDAHKWTERLHLPFSFNTFPDLLRFTIQTVLKS